MIKFLAFFIVPFCRFMSTVVLWKANISQHDEDLYFSIFYHFIHRLCVNRIQFYPRVPVDKSTVLPRVNFNMCNLVCDLSRGSYPQIFAAVFCLLSRLVRALYDRHRDGLFKPPQLVDSFPDGKRCV